MSSKSVEIKLEELIKAWVAANYQGASEPLNGVHLECGHVSDVQSNAERIVFEAGARGGAHLEQGNYEVPVEIVVITNQNATTAVTKHAQRVEAIMGIFEQSGVAAACTAIAALDSDTANVLRISAFWPGPHQSARVNGNFVTSLPFVFACHLAAP